MKRHEAAARILTFTVIGMFATLTGVCLDAFCTQQGVSASSMLYASNVLVGIVTGMLVLQRKSRMRAQRQVLEERIEVLSEMHQHIRSIVTALALYSPRPGSTESEVLAELLRRVDAHLGDLFTKLIFDPSAPQNAVRAVSRIRSFSRSGNYGSAPTL